ncbi:MAG: response regulator transcription factor [Candidatus Obscuribacterales bacterium]|nr:response regulator transcription factor [Candidatus Obscuribacterales bacterium]HNB23168.1 response regulator transcription factor [Candidatus Melainabacteria bacterium]
MSPDCKQVIDMHILLADDHAMFRSGLKHIIDEEFADSIVDEAASCSEVIEKVRAGNWDLIILDIAMGGQMSLNILPDLKRQAPRTPVMILSMYSEKQFIVKALRAGASAYLTKEHTPDELIAGIKEVIAGRKYMSQCIAANLAEYLSLGNCEHPHEALSTREHEVFILIARGHSVSEIAGMLQVSVKTVSTYRVRILEKMGLSSNAQLMRYGMQHGLVD